jgi:hypothetical protein
VRGKNCYFDKERIMKIQDEKYEKIKKLNKKVCDPSV